MKDSRIAKHPISILENQLGDEICLFITERLFGAKPAGARRSVEPNITVRNMKVSTTSPQKRPSSNTRPSNACQSHSMQILHSN